MARTQVSLYNFFILKLDPSSFFSITTIRYTKLCVSERYCFLSYLTVNTSELELSVSVLLRRTKSFFAFLLLPKVCTNRLNFSDFPDDIIVVTILSTKIWPISHCLLHSWSSLVPSNWWNLHCPISETMEKIIALMMVEMMSVFMLLPMSHRRHLFNIKQGIEWKDYIWERCETFYDLGWAYKENVSCSALNVCSTARHCNTLVCCHCILCKC